MHSLRYPASDLADAPWMVQEARSSIDKRCLPESGHLNPYAVLLTSEEYRRKHPSSLSKHELKPVLERSLLRRSLERLEICLDLDEADSAAAAGKTEEEKAELRDLLASNAKILLGQLENRDDFKYLGDNYVAPEYPANRPQPDTRANVWPNKYYSKVTAPECSADLLRSIQCIANGEEDWGHLLRMDDRHYDFVSGTQSGWPEDLIWLDGSDEYDNLSRKSPPGILSDARSVSIFRKLDSSLN